MKKSVAAQRAMQPAPAVPEAGAHGREAQGRGRGRPLGLRRLAARSRRRLTRPALRRESVRWDGRGGTSRETAAGDFVPAFLDTETGITYFSRFTDGRRAPMHVLDGLPSGVVAARAPSGAVTAVKGSLVAGFYRRGRFYTRAETAQLMAEEDAAGATPGMHQAEQS